MDATLSGSGFQTSPDRLFGVASEVPVVLVDHLERGAHHPRQLERRHPVRERLGSERVAQVVRATP